MRKSPHTEDEKKENQTPKSLCRTSLARPIQISQNFRINRITSINNSDISDKISSDSSSSGNHEDVSNESDSQIDSSHINNKISSPHISSLKRSQNNINVPNASFLQHISRSPNLSSYSSLKRNNDLSNSILDQIDPTPTNQELYSNQNNSKNNKEIPVVESTSADNVDSISNDETTDSFSDDGLVRTQVQADDRIETDDNFWSQEANHQKSETSDQIDADDNDDKIENEMALSQRLSNEITDDAIEEASQNFSNPNYNTKSLLQSDCISEDDSDDQFGEAYEEIDSTVHSQFFKQQKAVFEFINEETDELDKWDFGHVRVIYAKKVDSEIDELNEESYRILARKSDIQHVKKQGDSFILGLPYHMYANLGKIYLIAPNISDKL